MKKPSNFSFLAPIPYSRSLQRRFRYLDALEGGDESLNANETLGDFLTRHGYSAKFKDCYLVRSPASDPPADLISTVHTPSVRISTHTRPCCESRVPNSGFRSPSVLPSGPAALWAS